MVNSTGNSKLYEIVKQTLSNYEAPYNLADWEQMQSLLDLAPKSKSFQFKNNLLSKLESLKTIPKSKTFKLIFSFYMLIGLAILGGAYLLYTFLNSPKTPDTINSIPQQKIETTINTETKLPVAPSTTIIQDVQKTDNKIPQAISTTDSSLSTDKKDIEKPVESVITRREPFLIEKIESKKSVFIDTSQSDLNKLPQTLKKGNEPAIPDTRDSSKGIIGESKEKGQKTKTTKKPAGTSASDSLTRYLNKLPQDSLKLPK